MYHYTRIDLQVLGTREARASCALKTLMSFSHLCYVKKGRGAKTRIIELSVVVKRIIVNYLYCANLHVNI